MRFLIFWLILLAVFLTIVLVDGIITHLKYAKLLAKHNEQDEDWFFKRGK